MNAYFERSTTTTSLRSMLLDHGKKHPNHLYIVFRDRHGTLQLGTNKIQCPIARLDLQAGWGDHKQFYTEKDFDSILFIGIEPGSEQVFAVELSSDLNSEPLITSAQQACYIKMFLFLRPEANKPITIAANLLFDQVSYTTGDRAFACVENEGVTALWQYESRYLRQRNTGLMVRSREGGEENVEKMRKPIFNHLDF